MDLVHFHEKPFTADVQIHLHWKWFIASLINRRLESFVKEINKSPVMLGRGGEGCVTFSSRSKATVLFYSSQLTCFLLWPHICSNGSVFCSSGLRSCWRLPCRLLLGLLCFLASFSFLSPISPYHAIGPTVQGSHQPCHLLVSLCEPRARATC